MYILCEWACGEKWFHQMYGMKHAKVGLPRLPRHNTAAKEREQG